LGSTGKPHAARPGNFATIALAHEAVQERSGLAGGPLHLDGDAIAPNSLGAELDIELGWRPVEHDLVG
jgi:hypothetical protein